MRVFGDTVKFFNQNYNFTSFMYVFEQLTLIGAPNTTT